MSRLQVPMRDIKGILVYRVKHMDRVEDQDEYIWKAFVRGLCTKRVTCHDDKNV